MNSQKGFESFLTSLQDALTDTLGAVEVNNANNPNINKDANEKEKREAFRNALITLCDFNSPLDDELIDQFIVFFENLYCSGDKKFRHMYSDACDVMFSQLNTNDLDNGVPFEVINLENNITMIKEIAENKEVSFDTINGLKKLQDHITLEKHRMQYMATQNRHHKIVIDELSAEIKEKINTSLKEASGSFEEEIRNTKNSLQKNYVTILGIFAAIVIAFMSATALSSSVLQSMAEVSIYRLSFTMLSLGFFVFNLICALFFFLGKITETTPVPKYLLVSANAIFLILIILTFVARINHFLN